MKRLNVAGHSTHDYENFKNLIFQMLEYDAKDRVRPLDALQHPFFKMGDLVDSKNSTGSTNSSSVPRTPTAPAAAVNQSNREFQTIQLAAMLNERSQLERSTLERSQLERIQSDEKADAFQYDLLQKYQKLYKSPGKQTLSANDLDRGFRAGQLRGTTMDDLQAGHQAPGFPFFLYPDDHTPDQHSFVNALAQQRTNNGERLAFHLASASQHADPHIAQHVAKHVTQQSNQHAPNLSNQFVSNTVSSTANVLHSIDGQTATAANFPVEAENGKRSRFRKQNSNGSLINFSSVGSNLNLAAAAADDLSSHLNSFAYADAFSPDRHTDGYRSGRFDDRLEIAGQFANHQFDRFDRPAANGRYARQASGYDQYYRQFAEHYPNVKQSRLDQPYQTISSTISSLNLLDQAEYGRDYSRCPNGVRPVARNHRTLSSSIGNLNLLNGLHRPAANHSDSFAGYERALWSGGIDQFYETKNSKRKSYANELFFK